MSKKNEPTKEQKRLIGHVLRMSGVVFLLLGVFFSFSPDSLVQLLDIGEGEVQIVSYALIAAGIADFLIAHFLFGNRERV